MNKSQMNLQDNFLNLVRKESVPVTVYLVSGVQLKGMVRGFDSFTIILESQGRSTQLVYKHAMASVVPARPVNGMFGPPREDRDEMSPQVNPEVNEAEEATGESQ
jgi:host factor-I protein